MTDIRSYKGIYPTIGNKCYLDNSAIVVGKVNLADDVSVWPFVVIRGDVNTISIGERTNIQDASVLHVSRTSATKPNGSPLIIGCDVTIGHKVMLHGCQLGSRILVGMGATIMDDAIIEDDVMIAAGALVPPNKILKSGYLYVGTPVKQARKLTDDEISFLKRSATNYVELKDDYLLESI
ncbi:gamma carbonic anhydrase family protein [Flocculibacter collagenilyticus]|uniref:gamma carbonic anhydrase family protein n=1 Tax=Flocculibacter collagenilyticus TaxID=2744479 RepID=UPI0018F30D9A|nr:gamma carbonic anhydrase family protein [Flocculibacter collagenilyticus]